MITRNNMKRFKKIPAIAALILVAGSALGSADECHFPMKLGVKILDYNTICRMGDTPVAVGDDEDEGPGPNPVPKGKRDGTERCYDHNGKKVKAEFLWHKGELQKGWAFVSTNQKIDFTAKDGTLHGIARVYSKKGDLSCEIPFDHGIANGVVREFYPSGALKTVYIVEKANKTGKGEVAFDKDGEIIQLSCGPQPVHPKDAEWCGRNGKEATVEISGRRGGATRLTHRDGKLVQTEVTDKEGQRLAKIFTEPGNDRQYEQKEYFATGRLRRSFSINNGKTVGKYLLYAESGALLDEVRFSDKEKPLEHKSYYLNGKLKSHAAKFEAAAKDAAETASGKKKRSGRAEDDQFFVLKSYHDNGVIEHEGIYTTAYEGMDKDRPVWEFSRPHGMVRNYNEDGSLAFEGNYQNGRAEGLLRNINSKGIKTDEVYRQGTLQSRKQFDAGDKLLLEEEFFEDGSRSKSIRHDENAEKI
ncbi:toxin-antitoxin system YwqK family antitoxin [Pelotalea chapellei]|uniref:Antitoxin component YwqK of YwqJK toxin-antitoxin module n=1 Tax=Pelotalea chapellei TaxID=44671 RepID=A0ABS5U627_9BACT|nr:hypothetical protein [Pelotalea chapellei]MBT1071104.1 hypothetical protein [Pelotalea chapellei]